MLHMKYLHLLIVLLVAFATTASAQETEKRKHKKKKEKEKVQVFNYVIDDPMDAFGNTPQPVAPVITLRFPDFYSATSTQQKDTTYSFEVYDSRDSVVNIDTLHDAGIIRFISMFKSYNDPVNTYVDKDGKRQPLPVSRIIKRWDKTNNRWMCIDYATNKYATIVEEPATIVRTAQKEVTLTGNEKRTLQIQYYTTREQAR